jgi:hypothetical protein
VLDPQQGPLDERLAFFGLEQFGRCAIVEQWQRRVEPMGRLTFIAEHSDRLSDDRNQTMDRIRNHTRILSAHGRERNLREAA